MLLIGFMLISISFYLGIGIFIDHAFNGMFGECNSTKSMSPETFKSLCEKQQTGTHLKKVKEYLGFVGTQQSKCNENGICSLQIEGGSGMFCDSCYIEYNKETQNIISTEWVFGGD
jgi:hypothetical protein